MKQNAAATTRRASTRSLPGGHLWRRIGIGAAVLFAGILLYLLFWPVPIHPYAWRPLPDPGRTGPYVPNQDLALARVVELAGYRGPEDLAVGPDGWLYTGVTTGGPEGPGAIIRIDPNDDFRVEHFVDTGGRPLGLAFDAAGALYVADALVGPLRFTNEEGRLVREVIPSPPGTDAITYADSVRVGPRGRVWYTSPSVGWGLADIRLDGMETRPTGRLVSYDPATGSSRLELDELMFANGVAHDPRGDFVLVCEWSRYRITRLWLRGERAGERDVFYDNLPGYPDNLAWDPVEQLFWVGLVIPRSRVVDRLHPHPFWMKVLPRIPAALQPQLANVGWLLGLDASGRLVRNFQDWSGRIQRVTGAQRVGDRLVLTSDFAQGIALLRLPPRARFQLAPPVTGGDRP